MSAEEDKKVSEKMGVIRTDQWLKDDFDRPIEMFKKLIPYFKGQNENKIYQQLLKFGMYRPNRLSKKNLKWMLEKNVWNKVDQLFQHYRSSWSGPDIPIFLFPLDQAGGFLIRRQESNKSGVSFPDKMFLFLSGVEDLKEIEAVFVHEFHHVCRLRKINKNMNEYTLLDSIIIEGLAEYAVMRNCGRPYIANWCRLYSASEMEHFWEQFFSRHLARRKDERIHDDLLYGGGRIPKLLGYALGFNIVENFYKNNQYSTKLSFSIPATKYIESNNIFSIKKPKK
ncbi:DUF2268 domain-containing protein [Neobacillus massiliamazoniensis]|uniref:YjaZ n=1 Tax=Neobacillus massiliamazoniensis TaxID=1499688 RepID=A0A0U1NZM9_9BACI|nr:DUF2268 domain-containing putative Zn-dependent protease [Neobacillus massiliamazoniensis]CRK83474.1 YjaZ [Neobacillus massiliamazoniensis]